MRFFIFALGFLVLSCSENDDSAHAFKILSLKHGIQNLRHHHQYAIGRTRGLYNENQEKYGTPYQEVLELEIIAKRFNTYCDSTIALVVSPPYHAALINHYNLTLGEIIEVRDRNRIVHRLDSMKFNDSQASKDDILVYLLQQNLNFIALETTEYIVADWETCGWRFSDFTITCKQNTSNEIELINPHIQQNTESKQINLKEIRKNGKLQNVRPKIIETGGFGTITFDTLTPGAYSIKGDVQYLSGYNRFGAEPFEYSFVVE